MSRNHNPEAVDARKASDRLVRRLNRGVDPELKACAGCGRLFASWKNGDRTEVDDFGRALWLVAHVCEPDDGPVALPAAPALLEGSGE